MRIPASRTLCESAGCAPVFPLQSPPNIAVAWRRSSPTATRRRSTSGGPASCSSPPQERAPTPSCVRPASPKPTPLPSSPPPQAHLVGGPPTAHLRPSPRTFGLRLEESPKSACVAPTGAIGMLCRPPGAKLDATVSSRWPTPASGRCSTSCNAPAATAPSSTNGRSYISFWREVEPATGGADILNILRHLDTTHPNATTRTCTVPSNIRRKLRLSSSSLVVIISLDLHSLCRLCVCRRRSAGRPTVSTSRLRVYAIEAGRYLRLPPGS